MKKQAPELRLGFTKDGDFVAQVSVSKLLGWTTHPFEHPIWHGCKSVLSAAEVLEVPVGNEASKEYGRNPFHATAHALIPGWHTRRVAWLVRNGWTQPVDLDVGRLGKRHRDIVMDGHHRLAAALVKNEAIIEASISGNLQDANELFGWMPGPDFERWLDVNCPASA